MIDKLKILWHYTKTKHLLKFKDRQQLLEWQEKQIQNFLRSVLPKSPFYTEFFADLSIKDWRSLPAIDKSIMMNNFDKLNTVGINKEEAFNIALKAEQTRNFSPMINDVTVGLSSGTSGNRGIFLVSPEERLKWAGTILAKLLPDSIFSKNKIAFFLRANSNVYTTVSSRNINFEFFDLLNPINEHIERLNKYQPSVLVAPSSMLRFLAQASESHKLTINPIKIISVAEVLDKLDEIYISMQFNQKVHQIYQCTEGFLAATCRHGTLHINEDMVVIQKEYLDKDLGKFMPIITDFSRTTQPIIRYKLNDILTERKEPCPCGSHFIAIEKIEGRCDDIFYLSAKNSSQLKPLFPDFISRAIIFSSELIEEYKVIQKTSTELEVYLKLPAQINNSERKLAQDLVNNSLIKLCNKFEVEIPTISFTEEIIYIKGKKLKRIESLVK